MVPELVLNAVAALGSGRTAQSARGEILRLLPQLQPGDLLNAHVEARLPDGSFKVVVAGQALRMELPAGIASGETLELEFLGREPLSFALKGTLAGDPAPLLSRAAQLIASLLPEASETAIGPLSVAKPVLAAPAEDAAVLGPALERALRQTGLFYESHQVQWLQGERRLDELLQEPQARLAPRPAPGSPVDAQALPLVQQQLALLDGGQLVLQLELWPGQWMRWEIEQDPGEEPAARGREPQAAASWKTRLSLKLPRLGTLDAALSLEARGVAVRIDASEPKSAALLKENSAALQHALAAAGIPALGIEIRAREAG